MASTGNGLSLGRLELTTRRVEREKAKFGLLRSSFGDGRPGAGPARSPVSGPPGGLEVSVGASFLNSLTVSVMEPARARRPPVTDDARGARQGCYG